MRAGEGHWTSRGEDLDVHGQRDGDEVVTGGGYDAAARGLAEVGVDVEVAVARSGELGG
jgi:hypothetical protein